MSPRPPSQPARRLAALRAVLASACLLFVMGCVPCALVSWGRLPTAWPDRADLTRWLTEPDPGTWLITLITLAGWVCYLVFAGCVVLEFAAVARHRAAPRLRGLGVFQGAAGFLVGAIVLIAPTAAAQAAAPAASAAAPAVPHQAPAPAPTSSSGDASAGAERAGGPVHTVRPGDTLWDLAERYLGQGQRWREIADLNPGVTAHDLALGTAVRLPADTRLSPGTGPHAEYTVRRGDSLSSIAEQQLGDASRWPQIFHNNYDQSQPGGGHFTDPDLITPGQDLALPAPGDGHSTAGASRSRDTTSRPNPPTAAPSSSTPTTEPSPATTSSPTPGATGPGTWATPVPAPATVPATPAGHHQAPHRSLLFLLGAGLLAAGILSTLATRRMWQQRARRRGQRIAMPSGPALTAEQDLRTVEDPAGTLLITAALRTAAVHLADAGRDLPEVAALVYGPDEGLTLHLAGPADPVPPFTADTKDRACWHCPADTRDLLERDRTGGIDAPYPSLVTIGSDGEGRTVLIDLERYGTVRISGPGRHDVLRSLAVDLATSPYADPDCLTVTITGPACPGLPGLVGHVSAATPEEAVDRLAAQHAAQHAALTTAGRYGTRQARTGGDQPASWTPHILLADHDFAPQDWQRVTAVTGAHPRTATAVVTTSSAQPSDTADWDITAASGLVTIPGTAISCTLLGLTGEDYSAIIEALAATALPDRPPAVEQPAVPPPPPAAEPPSPAGYLALAAPALPPAGPARQATGDDDAAPASDEEGQDGRALIHDLASDADFEEPEETPEPASDAGLPTQDEDEADSGGGPVASAVGLPVPAAPPEQQAAGDTVMIRVLGPVEVTGAAGSIDTRYRRTATELAAWLVLHPGRDHHALDEAIWPGKTVGRSTRNPAVSRLRGWLGADATGLDHLPRIASTADARYRFADTVTTDWHAFQSLVATGTDDSLRAALELVRGRPFSATPARHYVWAEPLLQEMIAAIVDTAADLGERRLAACDPRGALWAAAKGLESAPEIEVLHRIAFRAHHTLGDSEGLERAIQRLEDLLVDLQVDMEEETSSLLFSMAAA